MRVFAQHIYRFLKSMFANGSTATDTMLLEFLETKQCSLCIDEGQQVVLFRTVEEGEFGPGTRIVMNAIIWQEEQTSGFECPVCGHWNSKRNQSVNSARNW